MSSWLALVVTLWHAAAPISTRIEREPARWKRVVELKNIERE